MGAKTSQSRMNPSGSGLEVLWTGASIAPVSARISIALTGMPHSCISERAMAGFRVLAALAGGDAIPVVQKTMYKRRTVGAKRDPVKQWALPDSVFFAA